MRKRAANIALPVAGLSCLLAACASAPTVSAGPDPADLLDGTALFGEPVAAAPSVDAEILELSPAMRAFLERHTGRARTRDGKLKKLLRGMIDEGYLNLVYNEQTHTAAETFERRSGNCMSFTNLFVALARASGLSASYQMVEIPPVWDTEDTWIILGNHINVLVKGAIHRGDYVVDFNIADFQGNYERRVVADDQAFALFYNNRGVDALFQGDQRLAFAYFKRAVQSSPDISAPWVNLGALYSRQKHYEQADAAYRQALELEPGNKSALANLARLHDSLGHEELAQYYQRRSRYHRDRNPYYHYQLAWRAQQRGDFEAARAPLKRALRLKPDEHQFHFLKALLAYRDGDFNQARLSLQKASELAEQLRVKERYARKLAALES